MDSVDLSSFNGYRIQIDHNKISKVTEIQYNEVLAKIDYRPTLTPTIHMVEYNGHIEERYNNNRVSTVSYRFDGKLYGEYIKYTSEGDIFVRKYFSNGVDVTNDIIKFIGYSDDIVNFKYYQFREDEIFNIMAKYGHYFRFVYESGRHSKEFDDITKYCYSSL
jgi:hypothetical protein